jgi:hypothetical protein
MSSILFIVLIILLVGALPTWPNSANWGYYPSGGLGLVLQRKHRASRLGQSLPLPQCQ